MTCPRGAVVRGPDLFADHRYRPYVCLSDETHPFSEEEGLFVAVTTTHRPEAVPVSASDLESGNLPRESYVNPWTIVPIRHADIDREEGRLQAGVVEQIATAAAGYLGVTKTNY